MSEEKKRTVAEYLDEMKDEGKRSLDRAYKIWKESPHYSEDPHQAFAAGSAWGLLEAYTILETAYQLHRKESHEHTNQTRH